MYYRSRCTLVLDLDFRHFAVQQISTGAKMAAALHCFATIFYVLVIHIEVMGVDLVLLILLL